MTKNIIYVFPYQGNTPFFGSKVAKTFEIKDDFLWKLFKQSNNFLPKDQFFWKNNEKTDVESGKNSFGSKKIFLIEEMQKIIKNKKINEMEKYKDFILDLNVILIHFKKVRFIMQRQST